MKAIEKEKLDQLLAIVPDSPLTRLLHFADSGTRLPELLSRFASRKGYEYRLYCTDRDYSETMEQLLASTEASGTRYFDLNRPRYMQQGKFYDFVFVTSNIEAAQREAFVSRVHPIIKNGGNILFFLPKGDHAQRFEWMRLLEAHYYVATNTIDDLFTHYDLLISKKMHGWGG